MTTLSDHNQPILLPSLTSWGDGEWRKKAECRGSVPSEFFSMDQDKVNKVKKICEICNVKSQCLQFAITNDIGWGIYGGMTPKERNKTFKYVVSNR